MSFIGRLFRTPSNPVEARFNAKITKYQYMVYMIVFVSKIPAIWHILNLMLLNPKMTYTCGAGGGVAGGGGGGGDGGGSGALLRSASDEICPCATPVWDTSVFTETVQTKFGLICDKKKLISISETVAYFGMLIGAFSFGLLSDRFGRVLMYCVAYFVTGIAGIAVSYSPNVEAFFGFRLIEGFGAGGTIVTSFVLLIEYAGTKYRETITALYHIPINLGHLLIAGVSYGIRNAFTFQLVISIPMFLFVPVYFIINESPLWLLTKNYKDRAIKSMERMAKFNKQPDSTVRYEIEAYCSSGRTQQAKIQLYHIFKYKRLTINLLCMCYMYLVCGMGYYGVSQYISKMSAAVHLNIAISAVLVVPGTLMSVILLNRIGRKPFLICTSFGSGIFMLVTVVVPASLKPAWLKVVFACISNCFFFMSFIVVFLYGVELFPTQIRNSALGLLSLLSRAGMMIAPQINVLSPVVAGYVFAGLALVGGGLTFCLPETKNKELPSTLEEAESRPRK